MENGFIKVCACTPENRVADVNYNVSVINGYIKQAYAMGVKAMIFPELSITAYTCGDLFYDDILLNGAIKGLFDIVEQTKGIKTLVAVGLPLKVDNRIYNVGAVIFNGDILGFVPKTYLPNYNEFYEKRVFSSGALAPSTVEIFGKSYPFGNNLLFKAVDMPNFVFGLEICEDMWAVTPPSTNLALNGANIILNMSASNELVGKMENKQMLIKAHSHKIVCGYVYANCGWMESSTDLVFAGGNVIAENGVVLKSANPFEFGLTVTEIDVNAINHSRSKLFNYEYEKKQTVTVPFNIGSVKTALSRQYKKTPFVPSETEGGFKRAKLILDMQAHALAKRVSHTHASKLVVGLSGGLDSTLALLVCGMATDILGMDRKCITAVTMPCFGTTNRTFENSISLAKGVGANLIKVDIQKSVLRHFKDIKHPLDNKNVVYENAQARERTQVLMDIANGCNSLVVGTGDLSEVALGWSTYNGDHMSMYGVNGSIPKTLVRFLVKYYADNCKPKVRHILYDILDTPVSPELLPPKEGEIEQKTEDIVGPYVLHDFFLYHFIGRGSTPKKIFTVARHTFKEYDGSVIYKWLKRFFSRFFAQQFKRSCMPDGVKVGSVALSPRGDWKMPSDSVSALWLEELNEIAKENDYE